MELNKIPIKSWFGYTRRERRSAIILLVIIIMVIGLKYTVPEKNSEIEDITVSISGIGNSAKSVFAEMPTGDHPFSFDPNSASYDTLVELGLTAKEANTLINYRKKGGKFRDSSDLRKVYGIDNERARKLTPFIKVESGISEKVRAYSYQHQKPLLEINSCDSASLVRLPGIGPVLSARIIKYRNLLGGFARIEQLKEVYGLPEETYDLIKGRLYADTCLIAGINVNSADYRMLARLPYLEKYEVTAILKYRELNGRIQGISDLTENKLITVETARKVIPYLRFEK
jgi:competence protein ComEA